MNQLHVSIVALLCLETGCPKHEITVNGQPCTVTIHSDSDLTAVNVTQREAIGSGSNVRVENVYIPIVVPMPLWPKPLAEKPLP